MSLSARLKLLPEGEIKLNADQITTRDRIRSRLEEGIYQLEEVQCFCGEKEALTIAARDRYGLAVNTLLCMNCGLMRTSPRMTEETTKRFYKEDYRALYSSTITNEQLFETEVMKGRMLVRDMPFLMKKVETVYDLGCGAGGMLLPIAEAGKTVAGCDIGEEMLAVGRANGLELINGGPQDLMEKTGGQADLVLLSHVVEHFLDLREELEMAIQTVRPGGFVLVQLPGIRAIPDSYDANLLLYLQNAHTYHFTAQTLSYVLKSVGLDVVMVDEQISAAAMRPQGWSKGAPSLDPPVGEALSVLSFLAELERNCVIGKEGAVNEDTNSIGETSDEPWTLATSASLRVLAWPNYDDLDSIVRVLTVAEPLYGNKDACLCLRYVNDVDIPYERATEQLQKAFGKVEMEGDLNVLIVDDEIPEADWPRLGKAVTCVLQTDPEIDEIHTKFIAALGIEIISGK
ncbi:MAG: class I SAM-dependent methyltransferase [Proteobacteria bacterium]|nr:class I SAM-dependent methyltransferase [Pseudomonadota bacterium]